MKFLNWNLITIIIYYRHCLSTFIHLLEDCYNLRGIAQMDFQDLILVLCMIIIPYNLHLLHLTRNPKVVEIAREAIVTPVVITNQVIEGEEEVELWMLKGTNKVIIEVCKWFKQWYYIILVYIYWNWNQKEILSSDYLTIHRWN